MAGRGKKNLKEQLIMLRGRLKQFYAVNSTYFIMIAKLAAALALLFTVNRLVPGRAFLNRTIVVIAVGLFCSVIPWGAITFVSAVWLLAQLSAFSVESAVLLVVIFLILAVLSYILLPGSTMAVPLTPLLSLWKIPYVMPVLVGLGGGISGFVSVAGGLLVYYTVRFVYQNLAYLQDPESATMVQKLLFLTQGILKNEELLIVAACFSLTCLVIWLIGRMNVPYARTIAMVTGLLLNAFMLVLTMGFAGSEDFSLGMLALGSLLALVIGLLYNIFGRFLNYARTEKVQFEDDDYYYYVTAVPKVKLSEQQEDKAEKELEDEQLQAFLTAVEKLNEGSDDEDQEDD